MMETIGQFDWVVKWTLKWMLAFSLIGMMAGCSPEVPKIETHIKNGLLYRKGEDKPFSGYVVGKSREAYRNQLCTYKKEYKKGVQHGKTQFWYPDGTLESTEPYENGRINGMVVRYYPNGRLKARMHLVNGKRGGNSGEVFYSPDGKLLR